MKYFLIYFAFVLSTLTFGQNRHITLGIKNNGISFGNSQYNNGVRFNLFDKNVNRLNGFILNVINVDCKIINGIAIGGLGCYEDNFNGFGIGGLYCGASTKFNGLGILGLYLMADTLNGFFISSYLRAGNNKFDSIGCLNGVAVGPGMVRSCKLNGLSLSFMRNDIDTLNGVSIAAFWNKAKVLHGFQFGLWNVAENNKIFKQTPILNFNFRRKKLCR